jgi:hypothetical protein
MISHTPRRLDTVHGRAGLVSAVFYLLMKPIARVVLGFTFPIAVTACPVCRTGTGEAVRSGIFNVDFGVNLIVTVAPFVVFYAIAALVYYGWPAFLTAQDAKRKEIE